MQGPWASGHKQGLLSELSLGFPPQTGWLAGSTGTLPPMAIHCPVPALPPLPTLVSFSWSERLSQQQPHKPALCTQELNFPSVLEDLHYSSRAAAHHGLCSNPMSLQANPALCCWLCSILQHTSTLTFCIAPLRMSVFTSSGKMLLWLL